MNADGTPFARGQETFFELDQVPWDGWAPQEGDTVRFQLFVTEEGAGEQATNILDCCYGDTVRITLTGSAEKGYAIEKAD
ncbi:MAG: hypothetical protein IJH54_04660 [Clostridia bacterium]|nr:hypothetical protein [Clostridia bacterium]